MVRRIKCSYNILGPRQVCPKTYLGHNLLGGSIPKRNYPLEIRNGTDVRYQGILWMIIENNHKIRDNTIVIIIITTTAAAATAKATTWYTDTITFAVVSESTISHHIGRISRWNIRPSVPGNGVWDRTKQAAAADRSGTPPGASHLRP